MLASFLSLLFLLFGIALPMGPTDRPDDPADDLDCSTGITGTLSTWWGLTAEHDVAGWTAEYVGETVTVTLVSPAGDKAVGSQTISADGVRKLCEAINDVPNSEWNNDEMVHDIGPLEVDMTDGAGHRVEGGVFPIGENAGIRRVEEVSDDLARDLFAKLEAEAEGWG